MLAHHASTPTDVLLVLVPVSLLAAALFFANRRAQRQLDARHVASTSPAGAHGVGPRPTPDPADSP